MNKKLSENAKDCESHVVCVLLIQKRYTPTEQLNDINISGKLYQQ